MSFNRRIQEDIFYLLTAVLFLESNEMRCNAKVLVSGTLD